MATITRNQHITGSGRVLTATDALSYDEDTFAASTDYRDPFTRQVVGEVYTTPSGRVGYGIRQPNGVTKFHTYAPHTATVDEALAAFLAAV